MKLILLSGGSGKRLWPLSNDSRSKQFLKVLRDEETNVSESMVQRVWRQIQSVGLQTSTIIATCKAQVEILKNQLGSDVSLIVEPERRDTFPAIALAATYLYSMKGVNLDETIIVLPVDPYVEDRFFYFLDYLNQSLHHSEADLALLGVQPTYPSAKYGYILAEQDDKPLYYRRVIRFQEKPSEELAAHFIEKQALWNCGVFAFKLDYLINLLLKKGYPIQYEQMLTQYRILPKISFDYEVVEKMRNIVVVPYDGYWKDLGTWNTLTEEMPNRLIGKGRIADDCHNTHLINETDIPVAILGLSNVVVAASPDGILVTDKSASPRIKDFIDDNQTPMFEEREWGWVRVLDHQRYDDGRIVLTKRIGLQEGKNLGYRMYPNREEVWTIVRGEGEFVQNGNYMRVKAGNVLHIPTKTLHSVKALSDLEIIVVQSGIAAEPDHAVELYDTWADVEKHCLKI
ncbi:sugar phosphate nucleotidyltransferase [Paenibacillus cisolokensis]|uniref:sugar phosphate nucleotidyltransferase n=1 Tax=Paenibacillus cisolokensis TaxID=1658519 RepID=UPI003D29FB97